MSVDAHLEQLVRKHGELEAKIHDMQLHPSTDTLDLASLKRKKLKLKEEIERMRGQTRH